MQSALELLSGERSPVPLCRYSRGPHYFEKASASGILTHTEGINTKWLLQEVGLATKWLPQEEEPTTKCQGAKLHDSKSILSAFQAGLHTLKSILFKNKVLFNVRSQSETLAN